MVETVRISLKIFYALPGIAEEYDSDERSYPGGMESRYEYDACGRICAIRHMVEQGMPEQLLAAMTGTRNRISIRKERGG